MGNSAFKDFIPAGENLDGLGKGLTDFVPTAKPVVPTASTPPADGSEVSMPPVPSIKKAGRPKKA